MYESKDVISRNAYHPSGVWWGVVKLSSMNLPKLLQAILCHKAQSKHLSTYVKIELLERRKLEMWRYYQPMKHWQGKGY